MSYVKDALHPFSINRIQEQRVAVSRSITTTTLIGRPNTGFCESCQRQKPAPKRRNKGWCCTDCEKAA